MTYKSKEYLEKQMLFDAIDSVQNTEEIHSKDAIEALKKILAQEVDVNSRNEESETPLIKIINLISRSGDNKDQYYKIINLLLKNDELDVNLKDNNGRTALDLAVLYLLREVVDLLLDHKSITYDTLERVVQSKEQGDFIETIKERIRSCKLYEEGLEEGVKKKIGYKWYIIEVLPRNEERFCSAILDPVRKLYPFFVERAVAPFVENAAKKVYLYPRYVFVFMKLCDESLKIIKSIEGFFRFLGKDKPQVVNNSEIDVMLNNLGDNKLYNQSKQKYEVGESVIITQGAFKGFCGELLYGDYERGIVKVNVRVFKSCMSPVEVRLDQIERKD